MPPKNLDAVVGVFKDGELNLREYNELIQTIRNQKDYLSLKDAYELSRKFRKKGAGAVTKRQYAQCREALLFAATGTTRD